MKNNTVFLISLIILYGFIAILPAGTTGILNGFVLDAQTGEPIPGANIYLKGTYLGSAADIDGWFYILNIPAGTYDAVMEGLGYQKIERQITIYPEETTTIQVELTTIFTGPPIIIEVDKPLPVIKETWCRVVVDSFKYPLTDLSGILSEEELDLLRIPLKEIPIDEPTSDPPVKQAEEKHQLTDISPSQEGTIPTEIQLLPGYPNPFNPRITIPFTLPTELSVTLTVYDNLGRVVKHLLNGKLSAGMHRVHWNGTDDRGNPCASGIYYLRFNAGTVRQVQKLFLIR